MLVGLGVNTWDVYPIVSHELEHVKVTGVNILGKP